MKIAAVTENGKTISAHFGKAQHFLVLTIEDGQIVSQELRDKTKCGQHTQVPVSTHEHQADVAADLAARVGLIPVDPGAAAPDAPQPAVPDSHQQAVNAIADCAAVLARGMGQGMHAKLEQAGIRPVLTDIALITTAATAFVEGRLRERPERVH